MSDIVCIDCMDFFIEEGVSAACVHYWTSDGMDFYGCPHLVFVQNG
jgi:hypothetical protein